MSDLLEHLLQKNRSDDREWILLTTLRGHRYEIDRKGTKPDDPGWHECSCGSWEGYWSSYQPHVAEELNKWVERMIATALDPPSPPSRPASPVTRAGVTGDA